MATLVHLSAYPATKERGVYATTMQINFAIGSRPPATQKLCTHLEAVRESVAAFGAAVAAVNPGLSFIVFVKPMKGFRKLRGWDAMQEADSFGGHAWMREPKPGEDVMTQHLLHPPAGPVRAPHHEVAEAAAAE